MKVLMISGDKKLLEPGTAAYGRLALQKGQVEALDVLVWPQVHSLRQIVRAAREKRYDVVTAQDPFWRGLLAWCIAAWTGARLNVQVHADLRFEPLSRHILGQTVLGHADSIRAVSEKLADHVRELRVAAPVSVLPVYVDIGRFRNIVRRPHEHPTILWIGRFEKEKDPLAAIAIFDEVRKDLPDARLVMLGDGALKAYVLGRAEGDPAIEVLGWQDPLQYLSAADVVLSTSLHESWGASIVEALAAGVPVVAPDVGVAREAGATVVPRGELASAVIDAISQKKQGKLTLQLLDKEEWARHWKETL